MAKLVFDMNQSLDGFVDHDAFGPCPVPFRHFIEETRKLTGMVYGRRLYEIMRYWDADEPAWTPAMRDYAEAWRSRPKWVASRSLTSVGPNAVLIRGDLEAFVRALKDVNDGEIYAGGTQLARSLGEAGLLDEYRIYLHPVVLGNGTPYFAGPRPPLRFGGALPIGENVIRLTYRPL